MKNLKVWAISLLAVVGLAGCGDKTPPVTFTGLELDTSNVVTSFEKGSEFSSEGLVVTANYSDDTSTEITEYTVTAPDMTTVGEGKEVVVTCTIDGEEQTASYTIDVTKPTFVELVLDTSNVVTAFAKGSEFSSEGLTVTANYSDGSSVEVTEFTVTAPDMTTVGEDKEVVVTCTIEGEQQTAKYTVDVTYWTEKDLNVLLNATLFGSEAGVALPYINGMSVVTDKDSGTWWVELPNVTSAQLKAYEKALNAINEVVTMGEGEEAYDVTFPFKSYDLPEWLAEDWGYDPDSIFAYVCIPTFDYEYSDGTVYQMREYVVDEIYIAGVTEEGTLEVSTWYIDVALEEYFGCDDWINMDEYGFKSHATYFDDFFGDFIKKHYSSLAAGLIPSLSFPQQTSSSAVYAENIKSNNPFAEGIDDYDIAATFFMQYPSSTYKTSFCNQLVANGFTAGAATSGKYWDIETTPYTLSNKFVGDWLVEISEDAINSKGQNVGFYITIWFTAPTTEYTQVEYWTVDKLLGTMGISERDTDIDASQASLNKLSFESVIQMAGGETVESTANTMVGALNAAGFECTEVAEKSGVFSATATRDGYEAKLSFSEGAVTNFCVIDGQIGRAIKTPADLTAEKLIKILAATALSKEETELVVNEDYSENPRYPGVFYFDYVLTEPVLAPLFTWQSWADLDEPLEEFVYSVLPEYMEILDGPIHAVDGSGSDFWALSTDGEWVIDFAGYAGYTDSTHQYVAFVCEVIVGPASIMLG